MFYKGLLMAVLGAFLSAAVWANPVDPRIDIGAGSLSSPIDTGVTFQTVNGGGLFDYFNNTGQTITQLGFETTVSAGLLNTLSEGQTIYNVVDCTSGFFLNCTLDYNNDTGFLRILFSGVTTDVSEFEPPCDTEDGEFEGIPTIQDPVPPACAEIPIPVGHFIINLNDLNSETGSWNQITPNGQEASVIVDQINDKVLPEPSTLAMLGLSLLALAFIGKRQAAKHRI